ncbi:MAG: choline-binding transcriptional repressor BetI [Boseongicola sp.]
MPKLGMEPIRRAALIDATIVEIGQAGSLDVTVAQIARRAGVSSGLAHHYFGAKDDILLAAMRHIMKEYAGGVLTGLTAAKSPRERVVAIVNGAFARSNFQSDVVSAWLNFYVLALSSPAAARLHRIYRRRLRSNLTFALRPLVGAEAEDLAQRTAELIDGVYLNHGLADRDPNGEDAIATLMASLGNVLATETA